MFGDRIDRQDSLTQPEVVIWSCGTTYVHQHPNGDCVLRDKCISEDPITILGTNARRALYAALSEEFSLTAAKERELNP